MKTDTLIKELIAITTQNQTRVQSFKSLSNEELQRKPDTGGWNILECIEHLNRYGDFYIPEIARQVEISRLEKSETFKPGLLGDYFAKSMWPKEKLNKMKTFKSMNPANSSPDREVLDTFIQHQKILVSLLERAKDRNMTKIKTAISISKWIKLRLGDTFRVVVYHNLRHIVQAKKILQPSVLRPVLNEDDSRAVNQTNA